MNVNELNIYLETIGYTENDNTKDIVIHILDAINDFNFLKKSYPNLDDLISDFYFYWKIPILIYRNY